MNKKVELNCYLWHPENPDNKIASNIIFLPEEGIKIDSFSQFTPNFITIDRLYGVYSENKKITLKHVRKIRELEYFASDLFIGNHFTSKNIEFDSMVVNFSLLEEWSEITNFDVSDESKLHNPPYISEGDEINKKFSYTFPRINKIKIKNFEISFVSKLDTNIKYFKKSSIKTKAYIKINSIEKSLLYNEFIKIIDILQNFITLGISIPIKVQELEGFIEINNEELKIDIFRSQKGRNFEDHIHPLRMNFQLKDITDNLEKILKAWFAMYESLKPILNLYFGVLYSPFIYSEHEFLSLCQALEVYCRINCDNYYLSENDFKKIYDELCQYLDGNIKGLTKNLKEKHNLDRSFIDHLKKGTFKYANEYSLNKKLKTIAMRYNDILKSLPHNCLNKIGLIADTRNYFTHYTEELRKKVEPVLGKEKELALGLREMLEVCLLSEISIPKVNIIKRLKNRYAGYNFTYWN